MTRSLPTAKKKVAGGLLALLGLTAAGLFLMRAAAYREAAVAATESTPPLRTLRAGAASRPRLSEAYGRLSLRFEANRGQTDPRVKFLARGLGYTLFLTSTEAVLVLPGARTPTHDHVAELPQSPDEPPLLRYLRLPAPRPRAAVGSASSLPADLPPEVVTLRLLGANPSAQVEGLDELPGKTNYFLGNRPSRWRTNVPNYARARLKNVHPGVDLIYYGNQGQLEFDFVIAPGADLGALRLGVEGAKRLTLDPQGDLALAIGQGDLRFRKPLIYQEVNRFRRDIAGHYRLAANSELAFVVGPHDPSKPLVIDPVLHYSTYLGGANKELGYGIAVDSSGCAYVTGLTNWTTDLYLRPWPGLSRSGDAFVAKLSASGSALAYMTYLGGGSADSGVGISVDSAGSAYVTGWTESNDFPTAAALQSANRGGRDAFVAKLQPDGAALAYCTYVGGSGDDAGHGIAVDGQGNAYVTGSTESAGFPSARPLQAAYGGWSDAFVAKLNGSGSALLYSTFLGGGNDDEAYGIAVDSSGNAYVTGFTESGDFPTARGLQSAKPGWTSAFVSKVNAAGSALVYSTYLGGSGVDHAQGIAVDASGSVYVTGLTSSKDFPTVGPIQVANRAVLFNAFVAKLRPDGAALVYSSYLGGSSDDRGQSIAVDSSGRAQVTGISWSGDFPSARPLQPTAREYSEAFVAGLEANGRSLRYSTYLGGDGDDWGCGIAVDPLGSVYVTGMTSSSDFPTLSPAQRSLGGKTDAFVLKMADSEGPPCTPASIVSQPMGRTISAGQQATLSVTAGGTTPLSYQWYQGSRGDTSKPLGANSSSFTTPALTATTSYWVRVSNACGAVDSNAATVTVVTPPPGKPPLELIGLEVTQALQNWRNTVPLIAGKRTFVRAHVRGQTQRVEGVSARLRISGLDAAGRVVATATQDLANRVLNTRLTSIEAFTNDPLDYDLRAKVNRSFLFELPLELCRGTLELEVFDSSHPTACKEPAEPGGTAGDCKLRVKFQESPAPTVRFIGIESGLVGDRDPGLSDMMRAVRQIQAAFAIPQLEYGTDWLYLGNIAWGGFVKPANELDFLGLWTELAVIRAMDTLLGKAQTKDYYIGIIIDKPASARTVGMGLVDVGVAYVDEYNWLPHEFGHLCNRPHTPYPGTPVPEGAEPHVPPDGTISENHKHDSELAVYGFYEAYYIRSGGWAFDPYTYDLMTYAPTSWPSPHTYKRSRDFLCDRYWGRPCDSSAGLAGGAGKATAVEKRFAAAGRAAIISGRVSFAEDTGRIESVYSASVADVASPGGAGSYAIRLRDRAGREVARYGFEPAALPDVPSAGVFLLIAPWEGNTAGIDLLHGGKVLEAREASANAPVVTVRYPNGGESLTGRSAQVSWTASDADGDSLRYAVQYSGDGGATWRTLAADWTATTFEWGLTRIPGSRQALIRVLATDGFHTSQDQSDAVFTVARRPPESLILAPEDNTVFLGNQSIVLRGAGYDNEDGALPDANLTWLSDLNGSLGSGRQVSLSASTLREGTHTITLTARDSDGETGASAVRVRVFRSAPANAPRISAGGVVNGASFVRQALAAGSIVSLFGTNLALSLASASAAPLPSSLGGATVIVSGVPAPLFFVSPGQINFQMPWELQGQTQASVLASADGIPSAAETVTLASFSPGIFTLNPGGQGAIVVAGTGEVAAPRGSIPGLPARPVKRGEYLLVYCTGLGPVTNRPASGAVSPGSPLATTTVAPLVTIGGAPATASFSGLAPGFVGLYQVNVQVPPNAPAGSGVPVTLAIGGVTSNTVTIAVQ